MDPSMLDKLIRKCKSIRIRAIAILLNIIPHVVQPAGMFHCLASGPTVVLSLMFIILHLVDQAQDEAELYCAIIELLFTTISLILAIVDRNLVGALYGLFYLDLMIALGMDIIYMHKERGWTF